MVLFLSFAMTVGAHHLGIFRMGVVMFMVVFMGVGLAIMAVGVTLEELKLLVLAGMLAA